MSLNTIIKRAKNSAQKIINPSYSSSKREFLNNINTGIKGVLASQALKYVMIGSGTITVAASLNGCASIISTKPNPIYTGLKTESLRKLEQWNPLLGKEIGKLPDIQDGISETEVKALDSLVDIYSQNKTKFDEVFDKMYKTGKPDVRQYCSPLEALFWLVKDKKIETVNEIFENYRLEKLLGNAWNIGKRFKDVYGVSWISYQSNEFGKSEVKKDDGTIDKKWTYDKLTKRLNAPELISFWEQKNIKYEFYIGPMKSNKSVFKSGKANCYDLAEFSSYLLNKAGYDSKIQEVESELPEGHYITIFKDKGKIFTMDNTLKTGISGPFDKIEDAPYTLRADDNL